MSHKKLAGLLAIPLAIAVIGGGIAFASHQANAEAPQSSNQAAVDAPEPGDQPDKPGDVDPQDQQDNKGQKDAETND
jgi:cell division protein FtsN